MSSFHDIYFYNHPGLLKIFMLSINSVGSWLDASSGMANTSKIGRRLNSNLGQYHSPSRLGKYGISIRKVPEGLGIAVEYP